MTLCEVTNKLNELRQQLSNNEFKRGQEAAIVFTCKAEIQAIQEKYNFTEHQKYENELGKISKQLTRDIQSTQFKFIMDTIYENIKELGWKSESYVLEWCSEKLYFYFDGHFTFQEFYCDHISGCGSFTLQNRKFYVGGKCLEGLGMQCTFYHSIDYEVFVPQEVLTDIETFYENMIEMRDCRLRELQQTQESDEYKLYKRLKDKYENI